MAKRKTTNSRQKRLKDKERKRQMRLKHLLSSQPPDDVLAESAVPRGTGDRAVSAPPGNFPGQGSMGLPPFEEKPLARVQASPRVKMHSNAPRLPSPRGSRLFARSEGKAPSPDSPAWVCAPPRAPGPGTVNVSCPAGQAQLYTSVEGGISSNVKDEELYVKNDHEKTLKIYEMMNENSNCEEETSRLSKNEETEQIFNENLKEDNETIENEKLKNIYERQNIEHGNFSAVSRREKEKGLSRTLNEGDLYISCVQGSFHQGDIMFGDNAGTQCVANCLAGLSYHKVKNSSLWSTMDMNKILVTGDELYTYLQRSSTISNRYLLVEELPQFFECFNQSYEFKVSESLSSVIFPDVGFSFADFDAYPLDEALHISLTGTDGCFVCFGGNTLLIGKTETGFFAFDSHSRSFEGLLSISGKSSRVLFHNIKHVFFHLQSLAQSMGHLKHVECNLTGVHCKMTKISATGNEHSSDFGRILTNETDENANLSQQSNVEMECDYPELIEVSVEYEPSYH